jgi:DNA polymerase-1
MGAGVDAQTPDQELRSLFKQIKHAHPEEREAAKRGVHGTNYLLSAHGLHDEYPQHFASKRAAEEFQEFYFHLFPKLRQWHQATLERAHREAYLENHYQYRHYFYSVFSWSHRKQGWELGDDAKRAVAFVPSSDASAIQTDDVLELAADPKVEPHMRLICHDSVTLEVPEPDVDRVAAKVHAVMTRERPELGGLAIGAEVMVGPSLGEMEVWRGPQSL